MTTETTSAPTGCDCGDPSCPGGVPLRAPFFFKAEASGDDGSELEFYLNVRTTSWEWSGERTDLHDMFGLLWAVSLRARDAASVQIVPILNEFSGIESEIYAQLLVLRQTGNVSEPKPIRERYEAMGAESLAVHDLVSSVFGVDSRGSIARACHGAKYDDEAPWLPAVRKRLRLGEGRGYEYCEREDFRWKVFTARPRGVSVAEIGSGPAERLKRALSNFRPQVAEGVTRRAFRTPLLVNAVALSTIKRAEGLLALVEGRLTAAPVLIPIDSHLVMIGQSAMVAICTDAGAEAFADERLLIEERQERQGEVFLADVRCVWSEKINDARFEELIQALLVNEAGVLRVRQVGGTREADDGRDFMIDWAVRPPKGATRTRGEGGENYLTELRQVLAQVKVRKGGVGRHDLKGLRDTLDHYECGGLLVVAFPRVTTTLFDHLQELRKRGPWWVDWWGQAEIELRLRRNPGIAGRFSDLVKLERPADPSRGLVPRKERT